MIWRAFFSSACWAVLLLQTCFTDAIERWLAGSVFAGGNAPRRYPLRTVREDEAGRNSRDGQKADTQGSDTTSFAVHVGGLYAYDVPISKVVLYRHLLHPYNVWDQLNVTTFFPVPATS